MCHFNGNKIITGSAGGMLLTDNLHAANKVRKWATQSREDAPWYHLEKLLPIIRLKQSDVYVFRTDTIRVELNNATTIQNYNPDKARSIKENAVYLRKRNMVCANFRTHIQHCGL